MRRKGRPTKTRGLPLTCRHHPLHSHLCLTPSRSPLRLPPARCLPYPPNHHLTPPPPPPPPCKKRSLLPNSPSLAPRPHCQHSTLHQQNAHHQEANQHLLITTPPPHLQPHVYRLHHPPQIFSPLPPSNPRLASILPLMACQSHHTHLT